MHKAETTTKQTTYRLLPKAIIGVGLLIASFSLAAEDGVEYPVGKMVAYPILNISAGYRDGIHFDTKSEETIGSPTIGVLVGAGLQGKNRGHLYGVEYSAGYDYVLDGPSSDNQVDQRLVGYWGTAFTERHNFDVGFEYLDSHDPRGKDDPIDGARDSSSAFEPDEWHQYQVGGNYVFGTDESRGKLELAACMTCRRYDNNGQEYRDNNIFDFGVTLYARVAPKTHMLFQFINTKFDYNNQAPDEYTTLLDSTERRYLVGLKWEATRKTTGRVRVGLVEKEFEAGSGRQNYSEPLLDLGLDWRPNNNNALRVGFRYRPYEALEYDSLELESDDFIEVKQLDLTWSRRLNSRMTAQASAYYGEDDFRPSGRNDTRHGIELGLRYKTNKLGTIGVRYFTTVRDSSEPLQSYDDHGILIDYNIGQLFGFGQEIGPGVYNPNICLIR